MLCGFLKVETIYRVMLLEVHQTLNVFHGQLNDARFVDYTNSLQIRVTCWRNRFLLFVYALNFIRVEMNGNRYVCFKILACIIKSQNQISIIYIQYNWTLAIELNNKNLICYIRTVGEQFDDYQVWLTDETTHRQ